MTMAKASRRKALPGLKSSTSSFGGSCNAIVEKSASLGKAAWALSVSAASVISVAVSGSSGCSVSSGAAHNGVALTTIKRHSATEKGEEEQEAATVLVTIAPRERTRRGQPDKTRAIAVRRGETRFPWCP